jgi:cytochrome P450
VTLQTAAIPLDTLPFLDPASAQFRRDPYGILQQLRSRHWAALSPYGIHLLTYDACNALLRDKRFHQGSALIARSSGLTAGDFYDSWTSSMTAQQGVDHARLRRLVAPYFHHRSIQTLQGYVRELTGRLADRAGDRSEFFSAVANVIPGAFFCTMIGAPETDAGYVARLSEDLLSVFNMDPANVPRIEAGHAQITSYVEDLLEERRRRPGGTDMLSALLEAESEGSRLTGAEVVNLVITTLEASTDNTSNQLALAVLLGCRHPEAWAELSADPTLADAWLEETMRLEPRIVNAQRSADADVEFRGLRVPAGSLVFATVASAHRDPDAYPNPDRFDLHRVDPRPSLNFGAGPHYCIGAPLVRLQVTEALAVLARRWPVMRLAEEPVIRYGLGVTDVESLLLHVGPA